MTERTEQLVSMFLQTPFAMTEQQRNELSTWITQDTENTKDFIQASLFHRCIHDILLDSDVDRNRILQGDTSILNTKLDSEETPVSERSSEVFDRQLWQMLLWEEQTAPEIEVEKQKLEKKPIRVIKPEIKNKKPSKTTLITLVTSIAALVFMFIYIRLLPTVSNVEVATLTDTVNAQWAEAAAPRDFRLMTNHEPLMLRKGYAELLFDNNAKVVLEAPVEFQVLSYDQIKLSYGRLYATVPKEATGFIVSTPTSKIIDLGTEFGVETDFNGTTELHVIKGKTTLVGGSADNKFSILLSAGAAKKVTVNISEPIEIACDERVFARRIDSKNEFVWRGQNVSLADIVGGGNGFGTGQIDQGIDLSTGNITQTLLSNSVYLGPEGYIAVWSNPYVDGVFVPGINDDSTQIDSTGKQTTVFPKTSGQAWGYIFDGAWHQSDDVTRHALELEGISLGNRANPALTMHSNMGITFDLTAIRATLPGVKIKSFSSKFGVSQTVEKWIKSDFEGWERTSEVEKLAEEQHSSAEFWIFLDGSKVLQQTCTSSSKAGKINIPIDDEVQFLTLAVTEADDTFMFDWSLFARPELILEATNK